MCRLRIQNFFQLSSNTTELTGLKCRGRQCRRPARRWQQSVRVTNRQKVGATIRKRRIELGYSQEGFAQYAGFDRSQYGRMERGEANINLDTLFYLAGYLALPPYRLIRDITLDDVLLAEDHFERR